LRGPPRAAARDPPDLRPGGRAEALLALQRVQPPAARGGEVRGRGARAAPCARCARALLRVPGVPARLLGGLARAADPAGRRGAAGGPSGPGGLTVLLGSGIVFGAPSRYDGARCGPPDRFELDLTRSRGLTHGSSTRMARTSGVGRSGPSADHD